MSQKFDDHAAVLGASMGGLLADLVADGSLVLHAPREFPDSVPKPLLHGSGERCVPVSGHAVAPGILGEDDDIGAFPCGPSLADLAISLGFGLARRSVPGGVACGS